MFVNSAVGYRNDTDLSSLTPALSLSGAVAAAGARSACLGDAAEYYHLHSYNLLKFRTITVKGM